MPLSDLKCLDALDSLESHGRLPDACASEPLLKEGLIAPENGGWRLTVKGRLRLANLRSLERQRQKR